MRQLILDTETTGLDPTYGHRIIELAMLEMVDRTLTGNKFHLYFNPQRDIPAEATAVHGISLSDLHDAPLFEDKIDEIIEFIKDAELIFPDSSRSNLILTPLTPFRVNRSCSLYMSSYSGCPGTNAFKTEASLR